jgi:hypothetical protein
MLTPGRPVNNRTPQFQFWQDSEIEATFSPQYFLIDKVLSKCCNRSVPLLTDAIDALKQQLVSDCQRVLEIRNEKRKYADAYNRYVAFQRELQERATRIDELAGLLGPDGVLKAELEDQTDAIGNTLEVHTAIAQLRNELPLWKAMRWYVAYSGEARINDVILFLEALEVEGANRSAIESALRKHPETFSIRRAKREKYLSLKGAE